MNPGSKRQCAAILQQAIRLAQAAAILRLYVNANTGTEGGDAVHAAIDLIDGAATVISDFTVYTRKPRKARKSPQGPGSGDERRVIPFPGS